MLWVLLISGILGFRVGMTGFPDWQVAVETSQVLAGFVKYPAGNPFFIYHIKLWTIVHQFCVVFLRLGVSEIRLSLWISGVLGMLTFQALSMVVYALCEDTLLSIGTAVLIFFTRAAEYGAVYGLFLMGTENTYGILGLSLCMLAVAMIGAGSYRGGLLLLGVAPAVHPSLGVWTGAIVACAFLFDLRESLGIARRYWRWFAAGCAVTIASLLIQVAIIRSAPHAPAAGTFSSADIAKFVSFWDGHRKPVDIHNNGVLLNAGALAFASIWLLAFGDRVRSSARFFLRFTIVSAIVSLALVFVSWMPPEKLPTLLLVFMPGRVLNFDAFTYTAMLAGILGSIRRRWSWLLALLLFAGLLAGDHSMLWEWLEAHHVIRTSNLRPLQVVAAVSIAAIAGAALERVRRAPLTVSRGRLLRAAAIATALATVVIVLTLSRPRSLIYRDRTNDVFFARVAAGRGLLATAGDLHLIQLKTRRPVLLDGGGLDGVMYSLEAGPAMAAILKDVYGVDLLNPPEEARGAGRIPPMANQQVWQGYSTDRWREIRQKYGVTQVLTYPDWLLHLPVAADSRRMLLYDIPE